MKLAGSSIATTSLRFTSECLKGDVQYYPGTSRCAARFKISIIKVGSQIGKDGDSGLKPTALLALDVKVRSPKLARSASYLPSHVIGWP